MYSIKTITIKCYDDISSDFLESGYLDLTYILNFMKLNNSNKDYWKYAFNDNILSVISNTTKNGYQISIRKGTSK